MSTPSPSPAVVPSPYNLAIDGVHDAIFSARQSLHAIESELEFYAATAMSCLAFLPAGDVPTEGEVARVRELEQYVRQVAVDSDEVFRDMSTVVSEAFTAAAVEGLTMREKRIGVKRTAPVQYLEHYLAEYLDDNNPEADS